MNINKNNQICIFWAINMSSQNREEFKKKGYYKKIWLLAYRIIKLLCLLFAFFSEHQFNLENSFK